VEGFQVLLSLHVYIYKRSYGFSGQGRVGTACIKMPCIVCRENLGGYLGLTAPFDSSFLDNSDDAAFRRECGLGVRSH